MSIEAKINKNVPLAPLTTFKIGGPAKFFIEIKSKDELKDVFNWAKKKKEKVYILGGGSNLLVNDKGVDGLVIRIINEKIELRGERLYCGAGAELAAAARIAVSNSLSGLEWVHGIPKATIGGAVRGNAGAFGRAMSDLVETVEIFNIKKNRVELFSNKDCKFQYRQSVFTKREHILIWYITLRLFKKEASEINSIVEKVLNFRRAKQPGLPSAGCVFKSLPRDYLKKCNTALYQDLIEATTVRDGNIGAGALIDRAGLKGKTIGGAKISLEHANFIVNTGQATAEDVIMLISYIKQRIRTLFGAQLQEEIEYFGFE